MISYFPSLGIQSSLQHCSPFPPFLAQGHQEASIAEWGFETGSNDCQQYSECLCNLPAPTMHMS